MDRSTVANSKLSVFRKCFFYCRAIVEVLFKHDPAGDFKIPDLIIPKDS